MIEARGLIGGQWQMAGLMAAAPEARGCSSSRTCRVQRACNSLFQFDPRRPLSLDKIPVWQHGGSRLRITPDRQIGIDRLHWGWDLKLGTGLLAAVVWWAGVGSSQSMVCIAYDRCGRIASWVDSYEDL